MFVILTSSLSAMGNVRCIAHRGFSSAYLENSMESVLSAIEIGSHGVEFDIQHTKDGLPVLFHDDTLKRVVVSKEGKDCHLEKGISDYLFSDLRENCQLKNGEDIPLLEEVLERSSDVESFFFVELKDRPRVNTLELLEQFFYYRMNSLRLISFKKDYLKAVDAYAVVRPFWKEIKMLRIYRFLPSLFDDYGVNIYHKTRYMSRIPYRRGKEVSVWTVNGKKDLKKIIDRKKVHFVTTDRPDLCLNLSERTY